jgi:hypothetical protein
MSPYRVPQYGAPYWGAPSITKEQEVTLLEDEASTLGRELEEINKRIQELKA